MNPMTMTPSEAGTALPDQAAQTGDPVPAAQAGSEWPDAGIRVNRRVVGRGARRGFLSRGHARRQGGRNQDEKGGTHQSICSGTFGRCVCCRSMEVAFVA